MVRSKEKVKKKNTKNFLFIEFEKAIIFSHLFFSKEKLLIGDHKIKKKNSKRNKCHSFSAVLYHILYGKPSIFHQIN